MWEDSSDFRAADIDTLNVHVNDHGGHSVVACASYWNAVGGSCGWNDLTDSNGKAQPGLQAWQNTGHFMYAYVDGPQVYQALLGIYAYIN